MVTPIELKQNTEEWHKWRKEGLGASEANIIMKTSSFMSPRMLWNEKISEEIKEDDEGNFITNKGHMLEAKARPLFELEVDSFFPDMIAVSQLNPIFRASLDGYSEDLNKCWECKFVGQDDFEKVKEGYWLDQYYPQLQHQLMVTGAESNYLFVIADDKDLKEDKSCEFPYKTDWIEVFPDNEYIQKKLIPSLNKFWKMVEDKKEPAMTSLDTLNLDGDNALLNHLIHYRLLKEIEIQNKANLEATQKEIFKIAKHNKNICNGVKITKSKSEDSTSFDHKKFLEENEMPEGYLKTTKGRITKRITFPKIEE